MQYTSKVRLCYENKSVEGSNTVNSKCRFLLKLLWDFSGESCRALWMASIHPVPTAGSLLGPQALSPCSCLWNGLLSHVRKAFSVCLFSSLCCSKTILIKIWHSSNLWLFGEKINNKNSRF